MNSPATSPTPGRSLTGRAFVHPAFDLLVIGGGLSLVVTLVVVLAPGDARSEYANWSFLLYVILLSNSTHFAASTVRLYTKPGAYRALPFLTMGFPLVFAAILVLCLVFARQIGPHVQALYLTWSPFHYAAQAYGLAVMYSYRSGCLLTAGDKKLLWWISMVPFSYMLLFTPAAGLQHVVSAEQMRTVPLLLDTLAWVQSVLPWVAFAAVVGLCVKVWNSPSGPMPVVSVLAVFTNAVWFFILEPLQAFVWATIFHGIQYLGIVIVFHVKDQLARPDNRRGTAYHVVSFYLLSLLLAYGLFECLPSGFVAVGFGPVESTLMVLAAINVHHFIVDAYIWRLGRGDSNRRVVEEAAA